MNPKIIVDPPGPKSKILVEREKNSVSHAHAHYLPIAIKRGYDNMVEDVDGNTYLDLTAGAAVMGVGYKRKEVVDSINKQMQNILAHSIFFATFEPHIQLAEKIKELIPFNTLKNSRISFGASGSEAVEMALSLTRTKKLSIISLFPSYHGRTLATNSLTGMKSSFRKNLVPLSSGVIHAPYPDSYRNPFGLDDFDAHDAAANYVENLLTTLVPPEDVGAIIMEPIGGSGGYQVPSNSYMKRIKKLCKDNDILFIADEIQTGFGRTGKMFGMEHFDIEPDMMTIGKVLGGGLPIGALVATEKLMQNWKPGDWGSTFGGNLLSMTAGLSTLEIIQKEKLDKNAEIRGKQLMDGLKDLMKKNNIIGDVRGKGLMLAFELVKDRKTKAPAPDEAKALVNLCMKSGLLISTCGTYGSAVRLLPPLTLSENEAGISLDLITKSLNHIS